MLTFVLMAYTGNVAPHDYNGTFSNSGSATVGTYDFSAGYMTYDPEGASDQQLNAANTDYCSTHVIQGFELSSLGYDTSGSGSWNDATENLTDTLGADFSMVASQTIYTNAFRVFNQGNYLDNITVRLRYDEMTYTGTSTWTVGVDDDTDATSALASGAWDTSTHTDVLHTFNNVAANSELNFYVFVTAPDDAQDGDYVAFTVSAGDKLDASNNWQDRDNWPQDSKYNENKASSSADGDPLAVEGDGQQEEDYTQDVWMKFICQGPVVYVDKNFNVTSNVLPFDTVEVTIAFDNDGSAAAENLTVIEKLNPLLVEYISSSATDSTLNAAPTNEKYTVYYSTDNGTSWGTTDPGSTLNALKWVVTADTGGDGKVDADNADAGDTKGAVDGSIPDVDAGKVGYKVKVK